MEKLQNENSAAGGLSDLTDVLGFPPVLNVCCGPKGMWFNKKDPRALYVDRRKEEIEMCWPSGNYKESIDPDEVADFTNLPFPDDAFWLVVMDPPHIAQTANTGRIVKRYGMLEGEWREMLRDGFLECFRVLKPNGTFIFKWNECRIPLKEILPLAPFPPLFGHKSGKAMQTHWVTFMKPNY